MIRSADNLNNYKFIIKDVRNRRKLQKMVCGYLERKNLCPLYNSKVEEAIGKTSKSFED